jgi:DMSO reductase family type II enzyme heme b subunit
MRTTRELIAAPTPLQPGGYVRIAYAERTQPTTRSVDVDVSQHASGFVIALAWECPEPVREVRSDPGRFCDAAALLAPSAAGAPWITMGAPGLALDGWLWRADGDALLRVRAEGLGTLERAAAPAGCAVKAEWSAGVWRVAFETREWPSLAQQRQLAVAVWRGSAAERGGLKSVTPGWIEVSA